MRIIVELLLDGQRLVKGHRFKDHAYVGDPENTIKLYNELKVDELVLCQIGSTTPTESRSFLMGLSKQAFMPVCYAGNINNFRDIDEVFSMGFDKIRFTSALFSNTALIEYAVKYYGRQAVVLGLDLVSRRLRTGLWARIRDSKKVKFTNFGKLLSFAISVNPSEILIRAVDAEGSMSGVHADVVKICSEIDEDKSIIYSGGISQFKDVLDLNNIGLAGVAVGAMAIFHGRKRGILVSYPSDAEMEKLRDGWRK